MKYYHKLLTNELYSFFLIFEKKITPRNVIIDEVRGVIESIPKKATPRNVITNEVRGYRIYSKSE